MTTLSLFNTLNRKQETVEPLVGNTIRFYTCGPTVYDYAHIGNFRTFVFEDVLRRSLRFFGYKVDQVMNLTDVDDKTIRGAIAKNVPLDVFTKAYKDAFFEDLHVLNIEKVEHYPAATDYIPEMIKMCQTLIEKEIAYIGQDKSVYFAISRFKEYGKLSHLVLDDLVKSHRVNNDEYAKDNASDFVLWKAYDADRDGTVFWDSPFGKGRPGWHLECSVMAQKLLGDTIDIHAGGVDLIFPHHENEIAQSECCTGKPFSRFWVHAEHLLVDGKKMSKSLGNFYTLRDILNKGYDGKTLRFMLLHTHYRTQLNFTFQGLDAAKATLDRIHDFMRRLKNYKSEEGSSWPQAKAVLDQALDGFTKSLGNDLNISEALSFLFELIREVNGAIDNKLLSQYDVDAVYRTIDKVDSVLGVCQFAEEEIPQDVLDLVQKRQEARKAKEWKLSDEIRAELQQKGYAVEDSPTGPQVKKL